MPKKSFAKQVTPAGLAKLAGRLEASEGADTFQLVNVSAIRPNPYQPRVQIDPKEIDELVDSISQVGILQPLICRLEENGTYTLVAGQRRLEAARKSPLEKVPVIEKKLSDHQLLIAALVENQHRKDLHPVDEARALGAHLSQCNGNETHAAKEIAMDRTTFIRKTKPLELGDVVLTVCASVPDLTWKQLQGLLSLPAEKRLAAAKQFSNQNSQDPVQKPAAAPKRGMSYVITTQSASKIVIDLRSRKKDLPKSEYIAALQELLNRLQSEDSQV